MRRRNVKEGFFYPLNIFSISDCEITQRIHQTGHGSSDTTDLSDSRSAASLVFIWALPFLSNAGFASCDHDWCAISQYIDNAQTTGAFWASVALVLLTFYVVQAASRVTPLTFSAALSLLLWGLFTSCPASRTMGLHNASLAGWTVMSIITTVLLNAWSRKKTGKWSVVSLIFTIAFTLTSAPFLIKPLVSAGCQCVAIHSNHPHVVRRE